MEINKLADIPEEITEEVAKDLQNYYGSFKKVKEGPLRETSSTMACLKEIIGKIRPDVYKIIDQERDYQDFKWGLQHDRTHEVESYVLYMEDYLQEARKNLSRNGGVKKGLDALRKVVALGIACFEVHGVPERKI